MISSSPLRDRLEGRRGEGAEVSGRKGKEKEKDFLKLELFKGYPRASVMGGHFKGGARRGKS